MTSVKRIRVGIHKVYRALPCQTTVSSFIWGIYRCRFCESTSVNSSDVSRVDEDALITRMLDSSVRQLVEKTCPQCPRFTVRSCIVYINFVLEVTGPRELRCQMRNTGLLQMVH
ncbi:hypothetical protein Y032_0043g776 [Ancylostoma ceylanicum]|uniref:Uncharacterized protein n=1 Tax=Ancylostoma ceylanicum TaxID=53326 RepID=A0A016UF93_9BILA|nr:hypothetical protein Y032_0043g776 [Ancylostoma ceylanicum]